jgi:hypothetical protein
MGAGVVQNGGMNRNTIFAELLEALPRVGSSEDPDIQIRAVLHPFVEKVHDWLGKGFETIVPDPSTCPNCGQPGLSLKTPYDCELCKNQAAFIRQFRKSVNDGLILDPERQMGMGQALWSLQGGGFPRRQTMVPAKVLAKVIERDGGVCQICGAPATEIDHTGSG